MIIAFRRAAFDDCRRAALRGTARLVTYVLSPTRIIRELRKVNS